MLVFTGMEKNFVFSELDEESMLISLEINYTMVSVTSLLNKYIQSTTLLSDWTETSMTNVSVCVCFVLLFPQTTIQFNFELNCTLEYPKVWILFCVILVDPNKAFTQLCIQKINSYILINYILSQEAIMKKCSERLIS